VLDVLLDYIWYHIRTKVLSPENRQKIELAAVQLERALGSNLRAKDAVLKNIQQIARSVSKAESAD